MEKTNKMKAINKLDLEYGKGVFYEYNEETGRFHYEWASFSYDEVVNSNEWCILTENALPVVEQVK